METETPATEKESKSKPYVRFSWEKLDLQCEWTDCSEMFKNMGDFIVHVQNHISSLTSDDFVCHWNMCTTDITDQNELARHILFHAFHTKIKCFGTNIIRRNGNLPQCMLEGITCNLIPDIPEEFKCLWKECGESYNNAETYYRHVDIHAEDYPRGKNITVKARCHWIGCGTSFTTLYRLKEHFRSHTQEKVAACPNCGGMFSSRTKLTDHLHRQAFNQDNIDMKEVKAMECGCCLRKFTTNRLLRDHMREHVNNYKCPYCEMTVPNPSALRNHLLYRHSDERNFACKFCEYRAKSNMDLRRHLECHSSSGMYTCPIDGCRYTSLSTSNLSRHISTIHKMEGFCYMCHICGKKYCRGNILTKHLISAHDLKWPSGHSRFRYQLQREGYLILQTIRYENVELATVSLDDDDEEEDEVSDDPDSPSDHPNENNEETNRIVSDENMTVESNDVTSDAEESLVIDSTSGADGDEASCSLQISNTITGETLNSEEAIEVVLDESISTDEALNNVEMLDVRSDSSDPNATTGAMSSSCNLNDSVDATPEKTLVGRCVSANSGDQVVSQKSKAFENNIGLQDSNAIASEVDSQNPNGIVNDVNEDTNNMILHILNAVEYSVGLENPNVVANSVGLLSPNAIVDNIVRQSPNAIMNNIVLQNSNSIENNIMLQSPTTMANNIVLQNPNSFVNNVEMVGSPLNSMTLFGIWPVMVNQIPNTGVQVYDPKVSLADMTMLNNVNNQQ